MINIFIQQLLCKGIFVINLNKMLHKEQLDTTIEVQLWTVWTSMDTTFKLDTPLNLYCDFKYLTNSFGICTTQFSFFFFFFYGTKDRNMIKPNYSAHYYEVTNVQFTVLMCIKNDTLLLSHTLNSMKHSYFPAVP